MRTSKNNCSIPEPSFWRDVEMVKENYLEKKLKSNKNKRNFLEKKFKFNKFNQNYK